MNNYTYEERRNVYELCIAELDVDTQITVAIEKMSKVIKELCEIKRGIGDREHLAEKIADATIMLEQLRIIFNINSTVCDKMDAKILRAKIWMRSFPRRRRRGGNGKEGTADMSNCLSLRIRKPERRC